MDAHPPPSPSLESVDFQMHEPTESRMRIAFLCNPNQEDSNVRGHHTSELFSDELDAVEKRASTEGFDCKWIFYVNGPN